jgi:hypothetical protein
MISLPWSGTDDDLPPAQHTGLLSFNGNGHGHGHGRASVGAFPFMRQNDVLENQIHRVEQDAYTGVLRAFKVQSDAISWVKQQNGTSIYIIYQPVVCAERRSKCAPVQDKESLITELRKELRVSDEEHRELLNKVNEDGAIHRMRYFHKAFQYFKV